ncbi:MAG TPA: hypothetical protein VFC42_02965 [Methylomirabilota bacterium]|jgi:hypothetical protein|nr:hypothetical protein [Methylomirabilota bacterium]
MERTHGPDERLAIAQGIYYAATGVWPLLSMRTFERVTGPKHDRWLVRTVGLLVAVIGGAVALAGARRRLTPELGLLAGASAVALGGIDAVYAARGRISRIYLLDAAFEATLGGAWAAAWRRTPRRRRIVRVADREFLARPDLWRRDGLEAFLLEQGIDPLRPYRRRRCRATGAVVFTQAAKPTLCEPAKRREQGAARR